MFLEMAFGPALKYYLKLVWCMQSWLHVSETEWKNGQEAWKQDVKS